jgi:hypothetical protein
MKQAASVKALQEIKDVTPEIAKQVREIWHTMTREQLIEKFPNVRDYNLQCHNRPGTRRLRMMAIDAAIGTHGVEFLGTSRYSGQHVHYCNTGDAYTATVIFSGNCLRVGCWGDLVEHRGIIEAKATEISHHSIRD